MTEPTWTELASGFDHTQVKADADTALTRMGLSSSELSGDQLRIDVARHTSGHDLYRVMLLADLVAHFTEPRVNVIESDTGFSVQVLGRVGIRYVEHGRTTFVDSEVLAKPGAIAVWPDSIKAWDPPNDSESITNDDRERIAFNIRRGFASQGYEAQVVSDRVIDMARPALSPGHPSDRRR